MKRLSATLMMCLAAAAPAHATEIGGEWFAIALDAKPVAAPMSVTFTADGKVHGQAPCNGFNGSYVLDDAGKGFPTLTFSPLVATRRACAQLAEEGAYFELLSTVDRVVVDQGHLFLITPDNRILELGRDPDDKDCQTCED